MAEWFKDWFNTDEYLDVYRHRNDAEARELVELILTSVHIPTDINVLDLACGTGRHSIIFAQYGFKVTAVDLSDKLLRVAKKAAEESEVKIDFVKSDIRNFSIDKKFHLILNLFTSFGYFNDDKENFRLFDIVADYLDASGYFVLDFFNKSYLEKNIVMESEDSFDHCTFTQKRRIENGRVIKDIYIDKNGKKDHYIESVRMYGKDEIIYAIEKSGLKIKNIFGGFDAEEFDDKKSQRIIIIAQK